jgi:hypothetical protein
VGRRVIKAFDMVSDIRSRVSDFELMAKYDLTMNQLEKVLEQLVSGGAMRHAELDERGPYYDKPGNRMRTRAFPRVYLKIPLNIRDASDHSNRGLVIDLSERGFRVKGISISESQEHTWIISSPRKEEVAAPIELKAICKWVIRPGQERTLWESGFQITRISKEATLSIRKLIEALGLGDCNLMRRK